jgi:hypothetical protein
MLQAIAVSNLLAAPPFSSGARPLNEVPAIAGHRVFTAYGPKIALLSALAVDSINETSSGRLWFGLKNEEVYFLDPGDVEARASGHELSSPAEAICHTREGSIFVQCSFQPGIGNHVEQFDGKTWSDVFGSDLLERALGKGDYGSALVNMIFQGRSGRVWFGVHCKDWGYLVSYDGKQWSAYRAYRSPLSEIYLRVPTIVLHAGLETSDDKLWFSADRSIFMLDRATAAAAAAAMRPDARSRESPHSDEISMPSQGNLGMAGQIYEDRKARIWFGTNWYGADASHLLVYDRSNASWTTYRLPRVLPDQPSAIGTGPPTSEQIRIRQIYQDRRGLMMIATDKGLMTLSPDDGKWSVFTPSNSALPAVGLHCLTEDHDGRIWVGTDRGVVVLEP